MKELANLVSEAKKWGGALQNVAGTTSTGWWCPLSRTMEPAGGSCIGIWGAEAPVYSVAWSPCGRRVASCHCDPRHSKGTILVWDAKTEELLRSLQHDGINERTSLTFSSDGRRLAANLIDSVICVSVETGEILQHLSENNIDDCICSCALRGDAESVAASSKTNVFVWDMGSGQTLQQLTGHAGNVRDIAISPDGSEIVSGAADRGMFVRSLKDGHIRLWLLEHRDSVECVVYKHCGGELASGSADGTIKIWNVEPFVDKSEALCLSSFNTDENYEGMARVLQPYDSEKENQALRQHSERLARAEAEKVPLCPVGRCSGKCSVTDFDIRVRPDGDYPLWHCGKCGSNVPSIVQRWQCNEHTHINFCFRCRPRPLSVKAPLCPFGCCCRRNDGEGFRKEKLDWKCHKCEKPGKGEHWRCTYHDHTLCFECFSPNEDWKDSLPKRDHRGDEIRVRSGEWVLIEERNTDAFGFEGGWWGVRKPGESGKFGWLPTNILSQKVRSLAIATAPSGPSNATDDSVASLMLHVVAGDRLEVILAATEDGNALIARKAGTEETGVVPRSILWPMDCASEGLQVRREEKTLALSAGNMGAVLSLDWAKHGNLASGSADNRVRVWDVESGQCTRVFEGHSTPVNGVAWARGSRQSPHKIISSASEDDVLRLWDMDEVGGGAPKLFSDEKDEFIQSSMEWSVDGRFVLCKDRGKQRLWDVRTGKATTDTAMVQFEPSSETVSVDGAFIDFGQAGKWLRHPKIDDRLVGLVGREVHILEWRH